MDLEIPIEYKGHLKYVTGLSRVTTCDDVIYALLRHETGSGQCLDVSMFRVYEHWPHFERVISGRTKVVKLWRAVTSVGPTDGVRLIIREAPVADILETGSEMSYGTRSKRAKRQSRQQHHLSNNNNNNRLSNLSKSEVYQHYHKKERRRRASTAQQPETPPPKVDDVRAFAELVANQQQQLENLDWRMREVDRDIHAHEALLAQQTSQSYFDDACDAQLLMTSLFPALCERDAEAYSRMCDALVTMSERVEQMNSKACYVTSLLAQERDALSRQRRKSIAANEQTIATLNALQSDYETSVTQAVTQQNELKQVHDAIDECEHLLREKQTAIDNLLEIVDSTDDVSESQSPVTSPSLTHDVTNTCQSPSITPRYLQPSPDEASLRKTDSNDVIASFKQANERSKGVRFNADVKRWLYDVMSEDESVVEQRNKSNNMTKSNNTLNQQELRERSQSPARHRKTSALKSPDIKPASPKPTVTKSNLLNHLLTSQTQSPRGVTSLANFIFPDDFHKNRPKFADDSNSDTGLSSMNSDEGCLTPPPLETLV